MSNRAWVLADPGPPRYLVLSKPIAISALVEALQRCAPAADATAASEPEVDDAVLRHLASVIGGPGTQEVIDVYLDDAPKRLAEFRRGLDQNDLELAERAVHTLKSTAATLGALPFASVCGEAEAAARTGDIAALRAHLPQLEARLTQVAKELRQPARAAELHEIPGRKKNLDG